MKKLLALCLVTGTMFSANTFAQTTTISKLDNLLLCSGWSERAKEQPYFLEYLVSGYYEDNKQFPKDLKTFNNSYKEKIIPSDPEEELNERLFYPKDKSKAIFQEIQLNGYHGAGFKYTATFNSNVNINEIKALLEKRDNFKFKNYSQTQIKQYQPLYTQYVETRSEKTKEQRENNLKQKYPFFMAASPEPKAQEYSLAAKYIGGDKVFVTYIGIEKIGTTKPKYVLTCGVGNSYED